VYFATLNLLEFHFYPFGVLILSFLSFIPLHIDNGSAILTVVRWGAAGGFIYQISQRGRIQGD